MNIIETHDLCKQYGNALRVAHLDLDVPEGSVYGFLGPNGAGKSTTLKMILGLVRPTAGSIQVLGKSMDGKNRLAVLRQVGSLIESPSYYGHLTGEENLRIVQTLRGVPEKNIREVLQIVRLDGQRGKKVAHYSLGMKQRLGLAAALLGYPKLLILDEPTNGLDPAGIQEMRELICELPERFGMTVVVSSHLLSEIDQMADHVAIIRDGELVFPGHSGGPPRPQPPPPGPADHQQRGGPGDPSGKSVPCQEEEGYLILPILSDELAGQFTRLLGARNLGVIRLEERQKSLEDIFLELTGKAASL